jgi:hypothetical protein
MADRGFAIDFPGTDEYIDTGFVPPIGSANRTVILWVKADSFAADVDGEHLVEWGDNNAGERWTFKTQSSGILRVEIQGAGSSSSLQLSTDQRHFIACVLDGTTVGDHTVYLDGDSEQLSGATTVNTTAGVNAQIGSGHDYPGADWRGRAHDGLIEEVRIYDRALSAEEIKRLYEDPFGPIRMDLRAPLFVFICGQAAFPDADLTKGSWQTDAGSTSNLFAAVDETTPNDADYVQVDNPSSSDYVEFSLDTLDTPATDLNHRLTFRARKVVAGSGNMLDVTGEVRTSTGLVATMDSTDLSTGIVELTLNLSTDLADKIGSFSDLRARFYGVMP